MRRAAAALAAILIPCALLVPSPSPTHEAALRRALLAGNGVVELPAGVVEISTELSIGPWAHDLDVRGAPAGTTLRASNRFRGRALIRCDSSSRVCFAGFAIDGNRHGTRAPRRASPVPSILCRIHRRQ